MRIKQKTTFFGIILELFAGQLTNNILLPLLTGENTKSHLTTELQCMSMKPKSTCHILLITSMRKGHPRQRENHQHTYMMSYYNDGKNNVLMLPSVCVISSIQHIKIKVTYFCFVFFIIIYRQNIYMTVTLIFLNLNQFGKFYSFMFKNFKKKLQELQFR